MSAKLNSSDIPKTRFEQAFINSLLNERGANSSTFYWIRLNDIGDTGEYVWFLHNSSSLPLSYTNWNKHQPGSQLFWLLTCRRFCFVVDISHIIFLSPVPQPVLAGVSQCQVDQLWVTGRSKTAGPLRPCQSVSRVWAVTMIPNYKSTTLMPTPPVLPGGNHSLGCWTVLRSFP